MAARRARGDGSVTHRKDGRWQGAVVGADGVRRYLYAKTKTEALAKVREATAAVTAGEVLETDVTVGTLLYEWLDAVKPTIRPSTFESYEIHVSIHLKPLHKVKAARLTPANIRGLQDAMAQSGLSPRSIGYTNTVLRMALKQAVTDGRIRRNVALLVKPPRIVSKAKAVLSGDELARLISSSEDVTYRALWAVCGGLGLRLGEALGLSWSDIDLDARTLTVRNSLRPIPGQERGSRLQLVEPKTTQSRRTLTLPGFVVRALADVPKRSVFVFTNSVGRFLDPRNTLVHFKRDLEAAGLPEMTIHGLRHTAAVLMLQSGTDLMSVSKVLGHTQISTTAIYLSSVQASQTSVADRMDAMVANAS